MLFEKSWVNFKSMSILKFCEMLKHVHNFNIIFYQMNVGKIQLFILHIFDNYEANIMMKINPKLFCDIESFKILNQSHHYLNECKYCQSWLKFMIFSFVILLMQSKFAKKNCIKCTRSNYKVWAYRWNVII
jgi:hypothetical protein